ncbi:MAG TPA: NADH-quinone oxidoreductase subunit C [Euzebyales bacterium]
MSPDDLATYLGDRLEQRVLDRLVAHDQLTLTVEPSAVPIAVQLCRDDPRLAFDFFDFLTGVDEREDGFAVIIHLYSTQHRHHIQIRALADGGRDAPTLPTISHLYRGANWHERETYDMFGITFDGHPGLLPRILTVENFEGFPLRKEFLLMTREVKPWPGLKEPKEVEENGDDDGDAAASRGPSAEEKARMAREKAERAKAKAAEARKRRARERTSADTPPAASEEVEQPAGAGEVGPEKEAALAAGAGDDEIASDPQQAAAVADDAVAKDAAAGAVGGDTAAGAPGDVSGEDQPVADEAREAEMATTGADATPSGTPGVEAEGRHAGAGAQAGDVPADETPQMTSDTQDAESAPPAGQAPDAGAGVAPAFQGDDGVAGLPPRGPGEEEPRALAGDGVGATPLADEVDPLATGTWADRPDLDRPVGTDADDRIRRLEDERPDEGAGTPDSITLRPAVGGQLPPVPGEDEDTARPDDADSTTAEDADVADAGAVDDEDEQA